MVASVTGKRWRRGVVRSGPITTPASLVAMTTVLGGAGGLAAKPLAWPWMGRRRRGGELRTLPVFSPLPHSHVLAHTMQRGESPWQEDRPLVRAP